MSSVGKTEIGKAIAQAIYPCTNENPYSVCGAVVHLLYAVEIRDKAAVLLSLLASACDATFLQWRRLWNDGCSE